MNKFHFKLIRKPDHWELTVDDQVFPMMEADVLADIKRVLAMKVELTDVKFGPVTLYGMKPENFAQLQDYLSMMVDYFKKKGTT